MKVVVHVPLQVHDHHLQQMMMLICKDYRRSKMSLVAADGDLQRNLDFGDMYGTTVM